MAQNNLLMQTAYWLNCLLFISLAFASSPSDAHEGNDQIVLNACETAGRPAPTLRSDVCSTCHLSPQGGGPRNPPGEIFATGNRQAIIDLFCPDPVAEPGRVLYNGNDEGSVPALWKPEVTSDSVYSGSLPVYWLSDIWSANGKLTVSSAVAAKSGGTPLVAAPDNCWGHAMNFGLIRIRQPVTLTVTLSPEASSGITPGFALYSGWDQSTSASRDETIFFGPEYNNPLGTLGLSFIGDTMGGTPGEPIVARYNLVPGNYELFVTVGSNASVSGAYQLDLATGLWGDGDTATTKTGQCGLANDNLFADPSNPSPQELCLGGKPGLVSQASKKRLTWTCAGESLTDASAQCYTLSLNGKSNQPPLTLSPGNYSLPSGSTLNELTTGGRPDVSPKFRKLKSSKGVKCKIKGDPGNRDKALITGKGEGLCSFLATKPGNRFYNDVQSAPLLIQITP